MAEKRKMKKAFGDDLLSHTATRAVPSALKSLTSVFEMGTGGASSLWSPKKYVEHEVRSKIISSLKIPFRNSIYEILLERIS